MTKARLPLPDPDRPIMAIVYDDGMAFEALLEAETTAMAASGLRLAGLVHLSRPDRHRRKCDLYVRDLATGDVHGISDDRGPHARGCLLNTDSLLRAAEAARNGLSRQTDLLVVCKFGKTEAAGGGLRGLVALALDLSVPVLIGVPAINLEAFRAYAGGLAQEFDLTSLAGPTGTREPKAGVSTIEGQDGVGQSTAA